MRSIPAWAWVILALLIFGGGGFAVYTATRGLRNNNPGNLRRSGDQWQGLKPVQEDAAFFQFVSPEYGIRALAKVLTNYQQVYGLNTVRQIITRFAPPSDDNPTDAYVANVARALGVSPDTAINVKSALPALVPAIIRQENGLQPYSDDTIRAALSLV